MREPQHVDGVSSCGKSDFVKFLKKLTKYDKFHVPDPVVFLQPLSDDKSLSLPTLNYFPLALSAISKSYAVMKEYNDAGYGCHFALHEFGRDGDVSLGRVEENCSRVRCFCVDVDCFLGVSEIEDLQKTLNPSLIVASSKEQEKQRFKVHIYWLLGVSEGLGKVCKQEWGGLQLALACRVDEILGREVCDKNIRSLSKTLRLPGFFHLKNLKSKFRSRVIYESGFEVTNNTFKDFFKGFGIGREYIEKCLLLDRGKKTKKKVEAGGLSAKAEGQNSEKRRVGREKEKTDGLETRYGGAEEGGRNQALMEYASGLFMVRRFSYNECLAACLLENKKNNKPPLESLEVQGIVDSCFKGFKEGLTLGLKRRIEGGGSLLAKELFNEVLKKNLKGKGDVGGLEGGSLERGLETFRYDYSEVTQFASLVSDVSCAARMLQRYEGGIGVHKEEGEMCAYNSRSGLWGVGDGEVFSLVRFVLGDMLGEEGVLRRFYDKKGSFQEEVFENFKEKLFSAYKCRSVCTILKNTPRLLLENSKFNVDGNLLHMRDGVLDLETCKLLPHDKKYFMTNSLGFDYGDVGENKQQILAYCENREDEGLWRDRNVWTHFVYEIMGGDLEMCVYLQKILGYMLMGGNPEELMFFFYGTGANGKSIFIETALKLMGSYGFAIPSSIFLKNSRENKATIVAQLPGKRLVGTSEIEDGCVWSEETIKNLSGSDTINARQHREKSFDYKPEFKTFVRGNHKPVVSGVDHGIWRRICLVPFDVVFTKPDLSYRTKFQSEAMLREVLRWAVAGFLMYREEGFKVPKKVSDAKAEYKSEMNPLQEFLGMYYDSVQDEESKEGVRCVDVLSAYNSWHIDFGQERLSVQSLSKKLAANNVKSKVVWKEGKACRVYNLRLKPEMEKKIAMSRNVISIR